MSGVDKFAGEVKGKNHHVVVAKEKVAPLTMKKIVTSEKITPSEEVEKDTNLLNDTE